MEFKKNRQKVIYEAVGKSAPQESSIQVPAFLKEAANVKVINNRKKEVAKRLKRIDEQLLKTLRNPTTQDKVYQTAQRLFSYQGPLNLRRDTAQYRSVWRKALRRFFEGRPPRKKEDLSIGDSINWEWIVACAKATKRDVVVVSRDADYGLASRDGCEANTWLVEELKERCNKRRQLILVDRLSAAFRLVNVPVKPTEVASEKQIIRASPASSSDSKLTTLSKLRRDQIEGTLESILEDSISDLVNDDPVSSEIASSNATGWGLDTFEITDVKFDKGRCKAHVAFSFSGDQDDDKPWCGTEIRGECVALIDENGDVELSNVSAELDRGYDEPPDETPPDETPPPEPPDEPPDETPPPEPPDELPKV